MALSIDDPETDRLAQELSSLTGESIADSVRTALRERLERTRGRSEEEKRRMVEAAMAIARRCSSKPLLDPRTPDEIVGYDENGLPT
jgi:antitoxin VapB